MHRLCGFVDCICQGSTNFLKSLSSRCQKGDGGKFHTEYPQVLATTIESLGQPGHVPL